MTKDSTPYDRIIEALCAAARADAEEAMRKGEPPDAVLAQARRSMFPAMLQLFEEIRERALDRLHHDLISEGRDEDDIAEIMQRAYRAIEPAHAEGIAKLRKSLDGVLH
jgi:hypothetical protein